MHGVCLITYMYKLSTMSQNDTDPEFECSSSQGHQRATHRESLSTNSMYEVIKFIYIYWQHVVEWRKLEIIFNQFPLVHLEDCLTFQIDKRHCMWWRQYYQNDNIIWTAVTWLCAIGSWVVTMWMRSFLTISKNVILSKTKPTESVR